MFLNVLLETGPPLLLLLIYLKGIQPQGGSKSEWRHSIYCTLQVCSHLKCCQSTGSFQHRAVSQSCCPPESSCSGETTLGHHWEVVNSLGIGFLHGQSGGGTSVG